MLEEEKVYTSMYSRNAELYHHGILDQKWGIQNGPPYPLDSSISTGKRLKKIFSRNNEKKQQIENAKAAKKELKQLNKEIKRDTVTSKAIRRAKTMSDDELKKAYDRLKMEALYAKVVQEVAELNKKNPTIAKKVGSVISKVGKEQGSKLANKFINNLTDKLANKINSSVNKKIDSKVNEKKNKDGEK